LLKGRDMTAFQRVLRIFLSALFLSACGQQYFAKHTQTADPIMPVPRLVANGAKFTVTTAVIPGDLMPYRLRAEPAELVTCGPMKAEVGEWGYTYYTHDCTAHGVGDVEFVATPTLGVEERSDSMTIREAQQIECWTDTLVAGKRTGLGYDVASPQYMEGMPPVTATLDPPSAGTVEVEDDTRVLITASAGTVDVVLTSTTSGLSLGKCTLKVE
jgi:hypothetical protein